MGVNVRAVRPWSIAVLVLPLSGCLALPIPHDSWLTGQHSGRIIDAASYQPVVGATVALLPKNIAVRSLHTISDERGQFTIGPIVKPETWYIIPLLPFEDI